MERRGNNGEGGQEEREIGECNNGEREGRDKNG